MRPIIIFLALAGAGIITWLIVARPGKQGNTPKTQAMAVSKHSDAFNQSVAGALTAYYSMTEDFVKWDSVAVNKGAQLLKEKLDSIKLDDIKKDSAEIYTTAIGFIDNAKNDVQTIQTEAGIRQKREAFTQLSDNLYYFLNTVNYDREKLYYQECPMAFDDEIPAHWISQSEEIRNPYLGLKHPKYGSGMIKCGETKKTINHTGKD